MPRNVVEAEVKVLRGECYGMLRGACSAIRPVDRWIADLLAAGTAETYFVGRGAWPAGQTLGDIDLRGKTGATVIAVVRGRGDPSPARGRISRSKSRTRWSSSPATATWTGPSPTSPPGEESVPEEAPELVPPHPGPGRRSCSSARRAPGRPPSATRSSGGASGPAVLPFRLRGQPSCGRIRSGRGVRAFAARAGGGPGVARDGGALRGRRHADDPQDPGPVRGEAPRRRITLLVLNGLPRHRRQAEALAGVVAVERIVSLDANAAVIRERIRLDPGGTGPAGETTRSRRSPDAWPSSRNGPSRSSISIASAAFRSRAIAVTVGMTATEMYLTVDRVTRTARPEEFG